MPFPTPLSVLTLLDPSSPTTVCRSSLSVATLSPPLLSVRLSVTSRRSSAMLPLTSSRKCPLLLPPPPLRSLMSFPMARSSPLAMSVSAALRLFSSLPSLEWKPAASTRPPKSYSPPPLLQPPPHPPPLCPELPWPLCPHLLQRGNLQWESTEQAGAGKVTQTPQPQEQRGAGEHHGQDGGDHAHVGGHSEAPVCVTDIAVSVIVTIPVIITRYRDSVFKKARPTTRHDYPDLQNVPSIQE